MAISPLFQGGGFPLLTGFGPSSSLGGFSNDSFGFPGITGFGFPPPFVDPFLFFSPGGSSFMINRLLGGAAGIAVPINVGPTPSTLGISPLLLGFPFFGGGAAGIEDMFGQAGGGGNNRQNQQASIADILGGHGGLSGIESLLKDAFQFVA